MEPSCPIFSLPYQIPTHNRCPPASLWLIILMLSAHRSLTVPCGSMSWLCQLCLEQEVYNSVGLSITGSVASICVSGNLYQLWEGPIYGQVFTGWMSQVSPIHLKQMAHVNLWVGILFQVDSNSDIPRDHVCWMLEFDSTKQTMSLPF